jgi:MATE family multidrug resistance protein
MLFMMVTYWGIGLPLGYGLGLGGLGGMEPGPQGFWIGLLTALIIADLFLLTRVVKTIRKFQQSKKIRLIE